MAHSVDCDEMVKVKAISSGSAQFARVSVLVCNDKRLNVCRAQLFKANDIVS